MTAHGSILPKPHWPASRRRRPLSVRQFEQEIGEFSPAPPFIPDENGIVQVSGRWDCLRAVARKGDSFLARLECSRDERENQCGLHPGLLDCATGIVLDQPGLVPAGCTEITIFSPLPTQVLAHAVRRSLADGGLEVDVTLCHPESGTVCLAFRGLRFAAPARQRSNESALKKVPVCPHCRSGCRRLF